MHLKPLFCWQIVLSQHFALSYMWKLSLVSSSDTVLSDGSKISHPTAAPLEVPVQSFFCFFFKPRHPKSEEPCGWVHRVPTACGGAATLTVCALSPQEASCAYVLIVTAVYWVSEAVPLGAAALVPAFLYPLFGVMKSSEVRQLCGFVF